MDNKLTIKRSKTDIKAVIDLPRSKSESNRALMIAAYGGFSCRASLSQADDTRLMAENLALVKESIHSSIATVIDCDNAGTVLRFMLTYLAGLPGKWLLTGSYRMKERPIHHLVEPLRQLGAKIRYTGEQGYPPLLIEGVELQGGNISVSSSLSSQYASSLLMAAPAWPEGLILKLNDELRSAPYLQMTIEIMRFFGAKVEQQAGEIHVAPTNYKSRQFFVSPDWSAASYWYELVSLSESAEVFLKGLMPGSLQGDSILPEVFTQLGVATYYEHNGVRIFTGGQVAKEVQFDLRHCPDLLPAIAASCCGLNVNARFNGVANLRLKETDRLEAISRELAKANCRITAIDEDTISLSPPKKPFTKPLEFNSYGDHRMAMAMAPLAMKTGSVTINNPEVVSKSYPNYWKQLGKVLEVVG